MASCKATALRATFTSLIVLLLTSPSLAIKIGDRTVYLQPLPQNWFTAYAICRSQGMQLMSIRNHQEYNDIQSVVSSKGLEYVWLAATNHGGTGFTLWLTTGEDISWSKWARGEPNNNGGNEHCLVYMDSEYGHGWNDTGCEKKKRFFCEEIQLDHLRAASPTNGTETDPDVSC